MFYCELGQHQSGSGEKEHKICTQKRDKIYFDKDKQEIGRGWEIRKEASSCANCVNTPGIWINITT